MVKKVAILMGSDSDLPVVQKAVDLLQELGIEYEAHVASAHRTPHRAAQFAQDAQANGFGVIIAVAGMAAHLAGVVAAHTVLPVIGLPCKGGAVDGLDALLSTVQMPPGVPVATVGLGAGLNAALLAAQILATAEPSMAQKLHEYKDKMAKAVDKKDEELQKTIYNKK